MKDQIQLFVFLTKTFWKERNADLCNLLTFVYLRDGIKISVTVTHSRINETVKGKEIEKGWEKGNLVLHKRIFYLYFKENRKVKVYRNASG